MPGYSSKPSTASCRRREIYFGDFKGERRWEKVREIPDQRMRDAVLNMVVYQGDTEFASNEQQRFLVNNAPSEYDLASLVRIMVEETRHGYQMCHLHGRAFRQRRQDRSAEDARAPRLRQEEPAAQRLQRRRDALARFLRLHELHGSRRKVSADDALAFGLRAAGAHRWGRCCAKSRFTWAPASPGLRRIAKAGVIPVEIQQKYYNKWISGSLDLFGTDHSGSAQWAYTWGIKGRVDEDKTGDAVDKEHLNERARRQFYDEVAGDGRARQRGQSRARRNSTCRTCASIARSATTPASATPSTAAS